MVFDDRFSSTLFFSCVSVIFSFFLSLFFFSLASTTKLHVQHCHDESTSFFFSCALAWTSVFVLCPCFLLFLNFFRCVLFCFSFFFFLSFSLFFLGSSRFFIHLLLFIFSSSFHFLFIAFCLFLFCFSSTFFLNVSLFSHSPSMPSLCLSMSILLYFVCCFLFSNCSPSVGVFRLTFFFFLFSSICSLLVFVFLDCC